MPPLDRHRVPPEVAHRLVALSAPTVGSRDGGLAGPGLAGGDLPAGTATAHPSPRPAPSLAPASLPTAGWTPSAPRADASRHTPTGDVGAAVPVPSSPATRPAGTAWDPSVGAALAAAAAARAPAPPPPRARVRWAPTWRQTGAAVLVLALIAGGLALRAGLAPRGAPVELPVPVAPDTVRDGDASAAPSPGQALVVHVVGAVAQPGVVRLPPGSRVTDAIAASGGSTPDADLAALNLARVLGDGEQLAVPVLGQPPAPTAPGVPAASPTDDLVDLNTADAAVLETLPGVGPVLAERIVAHRARQPFTSVDELDEVSGIGPSLLADLRPRVRV